MESHHAVHDRGVHTVWDTAQYHARDFCMVVQPDRQPHRAAGLRPRAVHGLLCPDCCGAVQPYTESHGMQGLTPRCARSACKCVPNVQAKAARTDKAHGKVFETRGLAEELEHL